MMKLKRILSMVLVLAMVLGMVPVNASAEETEPTGEAKIEYSVDTAALQAKYEQFCKLVFSNYENQLWWDSYRLLQYAVEDVFEEYGEGYVASTQEEADRVQAEIDALTLDLTRFINSSIMVNTVRAAYDVLDDYYVLPAVTDILANDLTVEDLLAEDYLDQEFTRDAAKALYYEMMKAELKPGANELVALYNKITALTPVYIWDYDEVGGIGITDVLDLAQSVVENTDSASAEDINAVLAALKNIDSIFTTGYQPESETAAAGSYIVYNYLWDMSVLEDGQYAVVFQDSDGQYYAVTFDADKNLVAVPLPFENGYPDSDILDECIWDINNGKISQRVETEDVYLLNQFEPGVATGVAIPSLYYTNRVSFSNDYQQVSGHTNVLLNVVTTVDANGEKKITFEIRGEDSFTALGQDKTEFFLYKKVDEATTVYSADMSDAIAAAEELAGKINDLDSYTDESVAIVKAVIAEFLGMDQNALGDELILAVIDYFEHKLCYNLKIDREDAALFQQKKVNFLEYLCDTLSSLLVFKENGFAVDTAALQAKYDEAKGINRDDYSDEIRGRMGELKQEAKALLAETTVYETEQERDAQQAVIDAATKELTIAINSTNLVLMLREVYPQLLECKDEYADTWTARIEELGTAVTAADALEKDGTRAAAEELLWLLLDIRVAGTDAAALKALYLKHSNLRDYYIWHYEGDYSYENSAVNKYVTDMLTLAGTHAENNTTSAEVMAQLQLIDKYLTRKWTSGTTAEAEYTVYSTNKTIPGGYTSSSIRPQDGTYAIVYHDVTDGKYYALAKDGVTLKEVSIAGDGFITGITEEDLWHVDIDGVSTNSDGTVTLPGVSEYKYAEVDDYRNVYFFTYVENETDIFYCLTKTVDADGNPVVQYQDKSPATSVGSDFHWTESYSRFYLYQLTNADTTYYSSYTADLEALMKTDFSIYTQESIDRMVASVAATGMEQILEYCTYYSTKLNTESELAAEMQQAYINENALTFVLGISQLELKKYSVDTSELEEKLAEAKNASEADFSDENWQKLQDAIDNAEKLIDSLPDDGKYDSLDEANAKQEAINEALKELEEALSKKITEYNISVAANILHANVNVPATATAGSTVTFTVTLDNAHYMLDSVSVTDKDSTGDTISVTINRNADDDTTTDVDESLTYTVSFTMPASDVTVNAVTSVVHVDAEDAKMEKTAVLEDNGTYTINLDAYTTSYPVRSILRNNTPLDIVLVVDQSGSIADDGYLDDLELALDEFVGLIGAHGRSFGVEHKIAVVGFASDSDDGASSGANNTEANNQSAWCNTGIFGSDGDFHNYGTAGFNYTQYTGNLNANGTYFVKLGDNYYVHLYFHENYYHLMDRTQANSYEGDVYGVVMDEDGKTSRYVLLTKVNNSGNITWLYGNEAYEDPDFYSYHTNVWTHRDASGDRQIHGVGTGDNYQLYDESHRSDDVYTRSVASGDADQSIYAAAMMNVNAQAGSNEINPTLVEIVNNLYSSGATRPQYGLELANRIFDANSELTRTDGTEAKRIVVMFTDGRPGFNGFDQTEANSAIAQAYIAKNTYDAEVFTIGLYPETSGSTNVDQYMNAVSSNYLTAQTMSDVYATTGIINLDENDVLDSSRTYFYNRLTTRLIWGDSDGDNLYEWYTSSGNNVTIRWEQTSAGDTATVAEIRAYADGQSSAAIYNYHTGGYLPADGENYYQHTDDVSEIYTYFAKIVQEITTQSTDSVELDYTAIVRDIMGQGFILTDNTVVTASIVPGTYNANSTSEDKIDWGTPVQVAQLKLEPNAHEHLDGNPSASGEYTLSSILGSTPAGTDDNQKIVITAYNTGHIEGSGFPEGTQFNATQPHTIDITGFDFQHLFISPTDADHSSGAKLVVQITNVEATDDVVWSHPMMTNNAQSGLWSPATDPATGEGRELIASFYQPRTVFVVRNYVLDYAKPMQIRDDYYAVENNAASNPNAAVISHVIHLDSNGDGVNDEMDGFAEAVTTIATKYGKAQITENGEMLTYTPTTMQWDGYDEFYAFGKTDSIAINAQDANGAENNLWSKFVMIPANNVYYEDSFVTKTESVDGTNISYVGIAFGDNWDVTTGTGDNTEVPENQENATNGGVQGWIDSMADDTTFSDGSAHVSSTNGATATFTFTGTGVDIYSYTDMQSGIIQVLLYKGTEASGTMKNGKLLYNVRMDNFAHTGQYYQIPTLSIHEMYNLDDSDVDGVYTWQKDEEGNVIMTDLPYGTYTVKLIVRSVRDNADMDIETSDEGMTDGKTTRSTYYLDGIRVYNPAQAAEDATNDSTIRDAYGEEEMNATFTEVRDILLDKQNFAEDSAGAVFVDQIVRENNEGEQTEATNVKDADIGEYEDFGPKNEVYLGEGQMIAFKVNKQLSVDNNDGTVTNYDIAYYVGLKSPTGDAVEVQISDGDDTKDLTISHTTDMYYRVIPDVNGIISISVKDIDEETVAKLHLSVTKLKTACEYGEVTQEQTLLAMESNEVLTYARGIFFPLPDIPGLPDLPWGDDEDDPDPEIPDIDVDIDNPELPGDSDDPVDQVPDISIDQVRQNLNKLVTDIFANLRVLFALLRS